MFVLDHITQRRNFVDQLKTIGYDWGLWALEFTEKDYQRCNMHLKVSSMCSVSIICQFNYIVIARTKFHI